MYKPHPMITPDGLERLQQRLASATAAYQAVCADNEVAATCGETSVWHDSFDYEENQRQMHMLAKKVAELRQLLAVAQVVQPGAASRGRVAVGCRVVCRIDDGPAQLWEIGGFDDGDPSARRLAYNSPLGQVLIGAEVGEAREWRVGGQLREVSVEELRG